MLEQLRRALSGDDSGVQACIVPLERFGFLDPAAAALRVMRIGSGVAPIEPVALCLYKLLRLLSEVADPDAGLIDFEQFAQRIENRGDLFEYLDGNPRAIEILVRVFSTSRYLTDTLLRHPSTLRELTRHRKLADLKSREEFLDGALSAVTVESTHAGRLDALRRYQRRELLRIGASDAFGLVDLRSATVQLSLLAQSLVQACLTLVEHELMLQGSSLAVLAMGKLGGEELNYSSDIDLIFLTNRQPIDVLPIAQRLVKALQDTTAEGFLYRVDVRLRPWGRSGELVTTVPSYIEYLKSHAELWEKQALLKARVVAGSQSLGKELLHRAEPFLFGASPKDVCESVRKAKGRIEADLIRRGRNWGEVKLGSGSIRDVEFVVQALQLVHGGEHPHVRSPNTLDALVRLADAGLIHADEYRRLSDGYIFLRAIEHSLQLMHNRPEHSLPEDERELTSLARRLDFGSSSHLLTHYEGHRKSVRAIFDKYLVTERALEIDAPPSSIPNRKKSGGANLFSEVNGNGEDSARDEKSPKGLVTDGVLDSYESVFDDATRQRHQELSSDVTLARPVRVNAVMSVADEPHEPSGMGTDDHVLGQSKKWDVTILGLDCPGTLSMICGLFFAHGFDIVRGYVSTDDRPIAESRHDRMSRRFVDTFTVQSVAIPVEKDIWQRYENELAELMLLSHSGQIDEAQGRLVRRVADALVDQSDRATKPGPIEVHVDNDAHERATILRIHGDDTPGFLYELANALTLSGIQIEQVRLKSMGTRVSDTLLVTDAKSDGKIVSPDRLQELQAAVVLTKHFTHLLPAAPNPHSALLHFRSFLRDLFLRPDWADQLSSLEQPEVLSALARLLGVSDFLWDDFLRLQYANLFPVLRDIQGLSNSVPRDVIETSLRDLIESAKSPEERRSRLNEFKDRELFRIDMRHILGHSGGIEAFGRELTELAEVVVASAVEFCRRELASRTGEPTGSDGQICPLVVCMLGKSGGRELGFASDIELMFVYGEDGSTSGVEPLDNATFFSRLVESVSHAIHARAEGIFHIDLRLRPYGRSGSLAVSLEAFRKYFHSDGPAWPYERQALVKLRPVLGDRNLACKLTEMRDEFVFCGRSVDFGAIRAMRERQLRKLANATEFHAKLSAGGLVDVEYLVQALQMRHGRDSIKLRSTNTREALDALVVAGVLATEDHRTLSESYNFLRRLIEALRMVRGDARDLIVPNSASANFESLARRLGYGHRTDQLQSDLKHYTEAVLSLVRLHSLT